MNEDDVKKIVIETIKKEYDKSRVLEIIKEYNKSGAFSDRKITDTPTDSFSPVNRRFVTLSSNLGARPISSVAVTGQPFFDTTNSIPMTFDGNNWRNGIGSIVAAGRNS